MSNYRTFRRGLSLLEVILALAILGVSLALVGELVRVGNRSAARARDLSQAELLAESVLNEVVCGALPPEPVQQAVMESDPDWLYSVALERAAQAGLVSVVVTVEKLSLDVSAATSFTVVRWMPDPGVELAEAPEPSGESSSSSGGTGGGNE